MNPEQIVEYLRSHPDFFEDHPELLKQLKLPHPQGGHLISLHERQLIQLRDNNHQLEHKLREWVSFAKENDALQQKLHDFVVALFAARDLDDISVMVPHLLQQVFNVPHVAIRIWQRQPPSDSVREFCEQHHHALCSHQSLADSASWFSDQTSCLQSFAYLPLYSGVEHIGLLVLASEEAQRFYPGMDTLVLQRLADVICAAIHPCLYHEQQQPR